MIVDGLETPITVGLIKLKKLIPFGKLTCKGGVASSPTFVIVKVTTVNCSLATDCLINVGFALQDWNWRLIGYLILSKLDKMQLH